MPVIIRRRKVSTEEWKDAIDQRDFDKIKELVQRSVIIEGNTTCNPLHLAASRGHHEIVEFLIQNGFSVDSTLKLEYPEPGFTPLHVAAQRNHLECARVLLMCGASVSSRIEGICDPINLAVFYNHKDMIALLLANGANVNARFNNNFFEKIKDYLGEVDVLGEKIHEGFWKDHNLPLLHYTILRKFNRIIEMLILNYNVNVNLKTSLGKTTLMQAVEINEFNIVHYLVNKRKANVNGKDNFGKSVIHFTMLSANRLISKYSKEEYCWRFEKKKILTFLVDRGVDINSQYPEDGTSYNTVIHYMIRYGFHEGLDYLLYYGNVEADKLDLNSAHLGKLNYQDLTPDIKNDINYIQHLRKSFENITYSLVTYAIIGCSCALIIDKNLILKSPIHEWITQEEYINGLNKYKSKARDELHILRNITIGNTDITLYDLAYGDMKKMIKLMSNKKLNIVNLVNDKLLKDNNIFYYYWPIQSRVYLANCINLNIKKSTELLTNWFSKQLPMDCWETIANYLDDSTLSELSRLSDEDK